MPLFDHYDEHELPRTCADAEQELKQLRAELAETRLELATVTESADEAIRLADIRRDRIDELTKDAHDAAEELRMAWAERDQAREMAESRASAVHHLSVALDSARALVEQLRAQIGGQ